MGSIKSTVHSAWLPGRTLPQVTNVRATREQPNFIFFLPGSIYEAPLPQTHTHLLETHAF